MKKTIVLLVTAAIGSGLFAIEEVGSAPAEKYVPWFIGLCENPQTWAGIGSSNAMWNVVKNNNESTFGPEDGKLVYDMKDGDYLALEPMVSKAPDTNTITVVEIVATLEEVETLPVDMTLEGMAAQTAIVVYTNAYNVWNGETWVQLAADVQDGEVTLKVAISYQDMNLNEETLTFPDRYAEFFINGRSIGAVELIGFAYLQGQLRRVVCSGSGSLDLLDGSVMEGVAENNKVKYGTIKSAMDAASTSGDDTVVLLRDTSEDIATDGSVKIDLNGKANSGTTTVPEGKKFAIAYESQKSEGTASRTEAITETIPGGLTKDTVSVSIGDSSKEAYDVSVNGTTLSFKIQTSSEIMDQIKPTSSTRYLTRNVQKLRDYLAKNNVGSYTRAKTTADLINTELSIPGDPTKGENPLQLWQDYVLGIQPTDSIAPVTTPAGDVDGEHITLSVPAIDPNKYSGDYTITYKVDDVTADDPQAIKVPLRTGTYEIQAILSDPEE